MPESPVPSESHSQTAAEFIQEQLHLEAEAREALPYQFDTCTRPLGAIRQSLFSCLTCNPPPKDASEPYAAAGVCYSCSISCHGEHTLVELFGKRNFVCDCGTTRLPETSPCTLRPNATTGLKDGATGEEPAADNKYNQNFRNKFCGCGEEYDPQQERGTMFQCLGLGTVEDGGCGEDWWHPECIVGLSREEWKKMTEDLKAEMMAEKKVEEEKRSKAAIESSNEIANGNKAQPESNGQLNGNADQLDTTKSPATSASAIAGAVADDPGADGNDITAQDFEDEDEDDYTPLPPGFPPEDEFDTFICYKCVSAYPWIKAYAGQKGFFPPVYHDAQPIRAHLQNPTTSKQKQQPETIHPPSAPESKKRKADDDNEDPSNTTPSNPPTIKRQKSEDPTTLLSSIPETTTLPLTPKKPDSGPTQPPPCILLSPFQPPSQTPFSLFCKEDFLAHLCHCPTHFPFLKPHPQLLEEEETYEPPVSDSENEHPAGSVGTGSIYDRGEAVFNNMDRVKAIQGAMAYAHMKEKLKPFLQSFAERGEAVGAEDIKAYFEKLRGDERGIRDAAEGAGRDGEKDGEGDNRREQSGY